MIHKRLEAVAQLDNGLDIILYTLLPTPNENGGTDPRGQRCSAPQNTAQEAILEWVLLKLGTACADASPPQDSAAFAHKLLQQTSPRLLAQVSSIHFKFFKAHTKFLVSEVEKLERVDPETLASKETVAEGVMIIDPREPEKSSSSLRRSNCKENIIASHFIQLALSGEHVKDVCLSLLKSKALLHDGEEISLKPAEIVHVHHDHGGVWYKLLTSVIETLQMSSTSEVKYKKES